MCLRQAHIRALWAQTGKLNLIVIQTAVAMGEERIHVHHLSATIAEMFALRPSPLYQLRSFYWNVSFSFRLINDFLTEWPYVVIFLSRTSIQLNMAPNQLPKLTHDKLLSQAPRKRRVLSSHGRGQQRRQSMPIIIELAAKKATAAGSAASSG